MYGLSSRGLGGSVTGKQVDCANPLTVDTLSESKACFCLTFPALCSTASIQAAQALINPDLVISPILAPPPHAAVAGAYSSVPAPYPCSDGSMATAATNCPEFSAAVDASIADQQRAWQAQNAATIAQTQANLDQIAAANPPFCLLSTPVQAADGSWSCGGGSTNWLLYGAIAVAAVLTLSSLNFSGAPRGYSR